MVDPLYRRFTEQRERARQRGIGWELPYWQWLQIWQDSGHLDERGRRKGEWQMARFGDKGPYSLDNVKIVRAETNAAEAKETQKRKLGARAPARAYDAASEPLSPNAGRSGGVLSHGG